MRAGRADANDLSVQPLHQRGIFGFRITNDDVVAGKQKAVGNLAFCRKTLSGPRCTEYQPVGILQEFPVHHDEVAGQGIDAIVQCLLAGLVKAQRQAAHQPFLLLEVQPGQLAVVLLGDGAGLEDVVVQLARGVGGVQHQEGDKEHSLVAGLQVLQQLFRLVAVGGKVARNDVHVISGANSFFLFLDLRAVQVGNLALHRLDGLHLVH